MGATDDARRDVEWACTRCPLVSREHRYPDASAHLAVISTVRLIGFGSVNGDKWRRPPNVGMMRYMRNTKL
jgi:hypothetical protein